MRFIVFFLKCLQLNVDLKNAVKSLEKTFSLSKNFIWIGFRNFSMLPGNHFPSGANLLTSSFKISDITKKDVFQRKFSQSDEQSS